MSVASQSRLIDELSEKAAAALQQDKLFEAERLADRAVELSRGDGDYTRLLAVLPTVEQARLRRLQKALQVGTLTVLDEQFTDDIQVKPGCYLVQPPLVGADARRLRLHALRQEVPASILCREPVIRLGLVPLVSIAHGATIRMKVHPPADIEQPDLDWFVDALDALGEAATEMDPQLDVERRIDLLLARLNAIPDHEGLHKCLEATCREAVDAMSDDAKTGKKK